MGDRSVQLNLSQTGTGADAVVVDGQNLSGAVRRVLLTAQVGEPPTLVLELAPRAFLVDAEGAQVGVSPVGQHVLTQLGWRPPDDGPPSPTCSRECQQELDRLGVSWDALTADRDALVALVGEILRQFTQRGHPGRPALRTGWVWEETANGWRARLAELTPPAAPEPVVESGGCPATIWDGPYAMRCARGAKGGVCAVHGRFRPAAEPTPPPDPPAP